MTPAEKASKKKPKAVAWGSRRAVYRKVVFPNNILRSLRESLNLTQRDVSVGAKINTASIADAEAGFSVTLLHALAIAKFFGKPVEELWAAK